MHLKNRFKYLLLLFCLLFVLSLSLSLSSLVACSKAKNLSKQPGGQEEHGGWVSDTTTKPLDLKEYQHLIMDDVKLLPNEKEKISITFKIEDSSAAYTKVLNVTDISDTITSEADLENALKKVLGGSECEICRIDDESVCAVVYRELLQGKGNTPPPWISIAFFINGKVAVILDSTGAQWLIGSPLLNTVDGKRHLISGMFMKSQTATKEVVQFYDTRYAAV